MSRPLSAIHIRLQSRSGKKTLTFVEGLAEDLDLKKIIKCLKRTLNVNGAVIKDKQDKEVLQLTGDQRENVREFFIKYKIWEEPDPKIIVHGF